MQRQLLLLGLIGLAYALGLPTDAVTATAVGVVALVSVGVGQIAVLNRRLSGVVEGGPTAYAARIWLTVSVPIFVVEAFYLLLTYSDIIVLKQFRPPNEVAIYYAAAKTLVYRWRRQSRTSSPNITSAATARGSPLFSSSPSG